MPGISKTHKKQGKFRRALSSALSVSPEEMQKRLREAKPEKPSPHKRYSYDPEVDHS